MTWLSKDGSGAGWTRSFTIEILPLIAIGTIFFVTQIYLNVRVWTLVSTEKEGSRD